MLDLIHQIIEILKNITRIFDSSILGPVTLLIKSVALLLMKVFELAVMVAKWGVAKM